MNNNFNMKKNILIISAVIMLSACGGRLTQDTAVAEPTEVTVQPQSYSLTGTIGEEKATMSLDRNGSEVSGAVTRCDVCVPIDVEGTWQGDNIKVEGVSLAGSHIKYELTVTSNTVQGTETLSAEGEVEEQIVKMTIESHWGQ